ncbi:MAG TPA: hypothetical protein VMQ51_15815 [Candidatus Binatia bacterium]|nr:hypothetical protein [Candidatus Binatia bacterium]
MKTIGGLGGISAQATMDLEARVHRISQQLIPRDRTRGYPPMVVCCTEIPLLLGEEADAKDLVSPLALLAEAAVRFAVGEAHRPGS